MNRLTGKLTTHLFCIICRSVAIKLFFEKAVEGFEREAAILKNLPGHPNVIAILEAFKRPWPCLITLFQANGSLGDRTRRRGPLPDDQARDMALGKPTEISSLPGYTQST